MRYRMVPEELIFWMGPIDGDVDVRFGVLCRRHADSLTVPRGWTLDDSRDPTLRLFRPAVEAVRRPRREPPPREPAEPSTGGEQLVLDGTGEITRPAIGSSDSEGTTTHDPPAPVETAGGDRPETAVDDANDTADGGLVRPPSSPLLARAFRGTPLER